MENIWIKNSYDKKCLDSYEGNEKIVVVPEGFTQLLGTFVNNTVVEEVILSSTITMVSDAFRNCTNLKKVVFNAGIQMILDSFSGCTNLTEIIIPEANERYCASDGIVYLKDWKEKKLEIAALGLSGVVSIPEGVEIISAYAFQSCEKITGVVFPETVRRIDHNAFYDCNGLSEIVIPKSVEFIEWDAFGKSSRKMPKAFARIAIPVDSKISGINDAFYFDPKAQVLVYPELPVTLITNKDDKKRLAFGFCLNPELYSGEYYDLYLKYVKSQRKNLISAAQKNNVDGVEAFFENIDKMPTSKTGVKKTEKAKGTAGKPAAKTVAEYKKEWIYYEGGYDKSVTGTETIRGIILKKYKGQDAVVEIPSMIGTKNVVGIDTNAFIENTTITSVIIPETVYKIGDHAFYKCSKLENVTVKGDNISIDSLTFAYCSLLKTVSICADRIEAFNHPFLGCEKLMNDDGLVIIGKDSYRVLCDCRLPITDKKITVPEGVVKLDGYCFGTAFNIDIKDPNGKLCEIELPDSLQEIGPDTFKECKNLKTVSLPMGVTTIDQFAFGFCSKLEEIYIPSTATNLSEGIFYNSDKVTIVTKKGSEADRYAKRNKIAVKYED